MACKLQAKNSFRKEKFECREKKRRVMSCGKAKSENC